MLFIILKKQSIVEVVALQFSLSFNSFEFQMALYSSRTRPYTKLPQSQKNVVCAFWLKGTCNRQPCRFLHSDPSPPINQPRRTPPTQDFSDPITTHPQNRVCENWISESCAYGDKCRFLHSWLHCDDDNNIANNLSLLTKLNGHKKAVTGIGLPSGSNKLYSGSRDGTVRVWDCESGKCVKIINNGVEIGCLVSEGSWVFLGLPNAVKAWRVNVANGDYESFVLEGPKGQVNSLVVYNDLLFAGSEDGVISIWKGSFEANPFKLVASIRTHSGSVLSLALAVGSEKKRLFSSSADGAIRVWDLENLECVQTLSGHTDAVMSLLFWNEFLFSCSLDKTIKVWFADQNGNFEAIHTHEEQCGVVSLFGMLDAEAKPVLLSSCKDSAIRLYELPSFKLRARVFSRREVEAVQIGPGGLFFLGDRSGSVYVWKWLLSEQQQQMNAE